MTWKSQLHSLHLHWIWANSFPEISAAQSSGPVNYAWVWWGSTQVFGNFPSGWHGPFLLIFIFIFLSPPPKWMGLLELEQLFFRQGQKQKNHIVLGSDVLGCGHSVPATACLWVNCMKEEWTHGFEIAAQACHRTAHQSFSVTIHKETMYHSGATPLPFKD